MNLTLHIIKKDLRRFTSMILCWSAAGLALLILGGLGSTTGSYFGDLIRISASATFMVLSFTLVAEIIQEDGLEETTVFWRTRPISAGRLLAAKVATLLLLLMVVPIITFLVAPGVKASTVSELGRGTLAFLSMVLSCAAVAACTKNVGRYILTGALCIVATMTLAYWTERLLIGEAPKVRVQQIGDARMLLTQLLCIVCASGILLSQYFWRNRTLSYALIATAVIGSALINSLWTWQFL